MIPQLIFNFLTNENITPKVNTNKNSISSNTFRLNDEHSKYKAKDVNLKDFFTFLAKKDEYKNRIHYPSSTKEWYNSIYSYDKSYIKPLIVNNVLLTNLLLSYFNMLEFKKIVEHKRRRANKNRFSANKIYISRPEIKHTNNKIIIILYTYNKQKALIEGYIRELLELTKTKALVNKKVFTGITSSNKLVFSTKVNSITSKIINRLVYILKKRFIYFIKWNYPFFKESNNLLEYLLSNIKKKYFKSNKMSIYNIMLKKRLFKLEQMFFNFAKLISFNKSKFSNLVLNLGDLGLICLIKKMFSKNIEIKVVELRSIHLNSDIFSSTIAWKLRDRKNRVVGILRRAILQMVKIPNLHTRLTFDDFIENINKKNILNVINQQVVSGVRFEASGRLTRRLTAQKSIFKYRYEGSLKNIRSSFNKKSSTLLRGHVKSNSQYTVINYKTRNGAFGLKGWVSSH